MSTNNPDSSFLPPRADGGPVQNTPRQGSAPGRPSAPVEEAGHTETDSIAEPTSAGTATEALPVTPSTGDTTVDGEEPTETPSDSAADQPDAPSGAPAPDASWADSDSDRTPALSTQEPPGPQDSTDETTAEGARRTSTRPSPMLIGLIAAGVLAVAGWGAFGVATSRANTAESTLADTHAQLTQTSADLTDTKDDLAQITEDRNTLQAHADDVQLREDGLKDREAAVQKREDDVKAREDAATTAEQRVAKNSFGAGTFQVGADIEPGTYHTDGARSCYWARLSGGGGTLDDIIANDNVEGPATVVIDGSDWGFQNSRCGTWTKVG